jgi:hypothetical protein
VITFDEGQAAAKRSHALITSVLVHAVPLVDGNDQRTPFFHGATDEGQILVGEILARVDHDHRNLGRSNGLQSLDNAEFLYRFLNARAATDAGGVDQREALAVSIERHTDGVARGAGHIGNDEALFAEQAVDQR